MNKKIVVLYHKGCSDGFGAAWVLWKKFKDRAIYWPMEYQVPPPAILKSASEVYMVDFGFLAEIMKTLASKYKITAIDHHQSQKQAIKFAKESVFDIKHSAAVLTWNHLNPKKPTPELLRRIEDVDLWKFKIKDTKEAVAWLESHEQDFKLWDKLIRDFQNPKKRSAFLKEGAAILRYQEQTVKELSDAAVPAVFEGKKAMVVNSPILASQIGNRLASKEGRVAIIWSNKNKKIFVSLRSIGQTDVSELAKRYGGGGHKHAAGFGFKSANNQFPWKTN
ncbi:MAG TPA: DHHA1 domain-containing protein [Candidatus Colwellbacteria bacterium]|nr:DHHA1 domain-containing protein [Candidatus Colwellbacteria bacterium]HQA96029.1 DHHA1 domain-containing protein [Candidatus Colwellbacteria bacterium]